ncbi:hypothetical protein JB92DRAFT_2863183 [Gautieria morchelliformis]|nr:hypothetical protein JB92DRAFT_2863120 [Gautieria morchelliformis]KAF8528571.1 hypothetical protein JB92DRAFT_2863183 [Gautieria morchelliformis]
MVAYTVFEIVVMVASISAIFKPGMDAGTLLLATHESYAVLRLAVLGLISFVMIPIAPFAVFLRFSTSRDILQAWFPCFFGNHSEPALDSYTTYYDKVPHVVSRISR